MMSSSPQKRCSQRMVVHRLSSKGTACVQLAIVETLLPPCYKRCAMGCAVPQGAVVQPRDVRQRLTRR